MQTVVLPNDTSTHHLPNNIVVPFIDLKRQFQSLKDQLLPAIEEVLASGSYILGRAVEEFESQLTHYLNCKYVLGVANGTDAIILALKVLNIGMGDEVILPVNSFIATAGAVVAVGGTPILCDVGDDLNIDVKKIESLITNRTKAIIPVHLTGRPCDMNSIMTIAKNYSLKVIEDAAQSIGATYHGAMTGTIGDIGCFSLHPLKNLHVYGDGGLVSTNNEELYQSIKSLRNHGLINRDMCLQWGLNSRLDAIQARMGTLSLAHLDSWNTRRREHARLYCEALHSVVKVPQDKPEEYAVYHNFVVLAEKRDELLAFLLTKGIETKIHYPIPIHLQPAARQLGYQKGHFIKAEELSRRMLSLPIYSELTSEEMHKVINAILEFYRG